MAIAYLQMRISQARSLLSDVAAFREHIRVSQMRVSADLHFQFGPCWKALRTSAHGQNFAYHDPNWKCRSADTRIWETRMWSRKAATSGKRDRAWEMCIWRYAIAICVRLRRRANVAGVPNAVGKRGSRIYKNRISEMLAVGKLDGDGMTVILPSSFVIKGGLEQGRRLATLVHGERVSAAKCLPTGIHSPEVEKRDHLQQPSTNIADASRRREKHRKQGKCRCMRSHRHCRSRRCCMLLALDGGENAVAATLPPPLLRCSLRGRTGESSAVTAGIPTAATSSL
nr:hypothetical protein Iba_chr04eCG19750 [Ipomoea batatas]